MRRVVISDASPLHYLILIGHAEVLPSLYLEVLIPEAVAQELQHASTPETVRDWILRPPSWLHIVPFTASSTPPVAANLDPGERDAIALALHLKADLVIMDEREGVEEAHRLGLAVTGTIGVLDRAAERGLISLESAVASLRQTNFRVAPSLLDQLLENDRLRKMS
jgi:predicted nucleic acid-binding protein